MNALVYSSSLVASFLGGVLALFAPCCVVSLLPTFLGTAVARGRRRLPVTAALFATGVAAILLPVVLGVGALGQVFASHRRVVFLFAGLFLAYLAVNLIAGGHWSVPMPALRLRTGGTTASSVIVLGLVSGIASSCCAPVLAGVVAMSALSSSIVGALGLGLAYVFGMVFPLFVAAAFWPGLAAGRRPAFRLPSLALGNRRLPWGDVAAATMFGLIAIVALFLAVTGEMTYSPDWLTAWNRWATGTAGDIAVALRGVPLVVQALGLLLLAGSLALILFRPWRARVRNNPDRMEEPA